MRLRRPPGLWHNTEFLKFWSSETTSQIGAQITQLSLQLTAVYVFGASPAQLGVLNAASFGPFLGLTLLIGVWVDRVRRRSLMVISNVGRALLVGSVSACALLGVLRMEFLYLAALALGTLTVIYDVSYQSYLPALVRRRDLVEGNSKLQATSSIAQVGGPGLAGVLVQVLGAPVALAVNAVCYVLSAGALLSIRSTEPVPPWAAGRLRRDMADGLRFVFGNGYLRACVLQSGTYNLCWMSLQTLFVLYAARRFQLTAGSVGLIMSTGAIGSLVGSLVARRLKHRLGLGPVIVAAVGSCCVAPALIPLAAGPRPVVLTMFVGAIGLAGLGATVANVHIVSLRQTITPDHILGRMNASYRFVSWGCMPVGALLGGLLGEGLGLRPALVITAAAFLIALLIVTCSPLPRLRDVDEDGILLRTRWAPMRLSPVTDHRRGWPEAEKRAKIPAGDAPGPARRL